MRRARVLAGLLVLGAAVAGAAPAAEAEAAIPLRVTATVARSGSFQFDLDQYSSAGVSLTASLADASFDWKARWSFADLRLTGTPPRSASSRTRLAAASSMGFPTSSQLVADDAGICGSKPGCQVCRQALATAEPFAVWGALRVGPGPWTVRVSVPGVGISQRLSQQPCGAGSGAPEDGTLFFSGYYVRDHDTGPLRSAAHSLSFAVPSPTATMRACRTAYAQHAPPARVAARCRVGTRIDLSASGELGDDYQVKDTSPNGSFTWTVAESTNWGLYVLLQFTPAGGSGGGGGGPGGNGKAGAAAPCVVPRLLGRPATDLWPALLGANCTLGAATTDLTSTTAPDTVLAQKPVAGRHLSAGAGVGVTLSPPPVPTPHAA